LEEGEVVAGFAFGAGGDAAHRFQPGVGAFDRPAVAGVGVGGALSAAAAAPDGAGGGAGGDRLACPPRLGDARLDAALADRVFERGGGVAAVSPELLWLDAAREQPVEQRQQLLALVLVAGAERDRERRPVAGYGQVVAAARPAQERARDLLAPYMKGTGWVKLPVGGARSRCCRRR